MFFTLEGQDGVLEEGNGFEKRFHTDGALRKSPFLPDRPTASFRRCKDQSFVRSEPQLSLQYLSVSVLKHREILRERTTPPRQQRAGSRQAPRTQQRH